MPSCLTEACESPFGGPCLVLGLGAAARLCSAAGLRPKAAAACAGGPWRALAGWAVLGGARSASSTPAALAMAACGRRQQRPPVKQAGSGARAARGRRAGGLGGSRSRIGLARASAARSTALALGRPCPARQLWHPHRSIELSRPSCQREYFLQDGFFLRDAPRAQEPK
jgi:hypothetical protein